MTEGATRELPTVTGFAAKCAIAVLRKHNIAVQPLLRRAGLAEHAFDNPRLRVSAVGQVKFLECAAEAMDDTAFGLHLAEQTNPREVGLLFYVVSAARNFGEAWELFARYSRIVNESARTKISRQREGVVVEVSFVGIPRHRARQITEFQIALVLRVLGEITGRGIRPTQSPLHICAARTCGNSNAPMGVASSLEPHRINWSFRTKHSLFR